MKKEVPGPAPASRRRPARWTTSMVRVAAVLLSTTPALFAQFGPAPKPVTVIQGGTVHVGNGDVIENGTVIVRGSRIEAVGKSLSAPEGATVVDASGMHVYPGLIDAGSTLLLDSAVRSGEGNVVASIVDALDPFDVDDLEAALRGGVTTVGVSSRRGLLDGRGAALKLKPRAPIADLLLRKDGAVAVTFGLNGDRPSMRLREWKSFADQLQATRKYVESWDDYKEKLEEYKKELEKAKKESESKKPPEQAGKKESPAPAPAPESKEPKPEEKKEEGGPTPRRGPRRRPGGSLIALLQELAQERTDPRSFAEGPQGGPPQQQPAGDEKKDEGPKKPPRPALEPQREVLRQVLEGKASFNVYVDHASDLTNLFELARQYHFRYAVTGGREAAHVARELAAAGVQVVVVQPHDLGSDALSTAAELDLAGVAVVLTTAGSSGASTRHLSLSAAAAIAGGMDPEHALAAITSRAALLLQVADRIGTLEAGKDADVVITRGELFSSSAIVERVLVDGAPVAVR